MIRFAAHLSCDTPGCDAKGEVTVSAVLDGYCSDMSGSFCKAELEADTYGNGWHELTEGRVLCDACYCNPGRFEVSP